MKNILNGKDIDSIATIPSWYAYGYLNVYDKYNQVYRIHVDQIKEMIRSRKYKLITKRKYQHLELIERGKYARN